MQGDKMKDKDVDKYLRQHLSGDAPQEGFKQQTLRDSTAALVRARRRRSAWRRAEMVSAAVLIAGVAFLGGRLSAPRTLSRNVDVAPRAAAEPDGVNVPSDLVAWLDAARLFRHLGMEERMARAVERASRLLPYDSIAGSGATGQASAALGDGAIEEQSKQISLADILGPYEPVESGGGLIAQSFGGNYHASKID